MADSQTSFPVLSIVGTTAVGKTDLAFAVAHALLLENVEAGVDIISADSRQVFQDLEVLTGADIPAEFGRVHDTAISDKDFFEHEHIRLFGVSMLEPDQDWSVSQFQQYAHSVIKKSVATQRSVMIVGGTGLFHKHVFNFDPRLHVAPNSQVRNRAGDMSVEELQAWLLQLDPIFFEQMNNSDRQNPRRLVRGIEIAMSEIEPKAETIPQLDVQHFFLGLTANMDVIAEKIQARVQLRMHKAQQEVASVTAQYGQSISSQVQSILGFDQLQQLLTGSISEDQCQAQWSLSELQYAKRQNTWWKAHPNVKWFSTIDPADRDAAITHAVTALRHGVTAINN